jgi:hypothetical protein
MFRRSMCSTGVPPPVLQQAIILRHFSHTADFAAISHTAAAAISHTAAQGIFQCAPSKKPFMRDYQTQGDFVNARFHQMESFFL